MSADIRDLTTAFLAERHALMAFIYGMVREPHAAEDIFQEVWLRLARAVEDGVDIENQPKWCRGVARNLILHHWRSNSREVVDSELIELLDLTELAFSEASSSDDFLSARQQALNDCTEKLPGRSRQLLALKYQDVHSIAEMAAMLNYSGAAVTKALLRLRRALATCVEKKIRWKEAGL
jgi:RNA polymerase sigma-70 factor (ECF subfamily)